MARPKANPEVRFRDVKYFLDQAVEHGGRMIEFADEREAIHKCHRMNLCRREMREHDAIVSMMYDAFVIRVNGNCVVLQPRPVADPAACKPLPNQPESRTLTLEETLAHVNEIQKQQRDGTFNPDKPLNLLDE